MAVARGKVMVVLRDSKDSASRRTPLWQLPDWRLYFTSRCISASGSILSYVAFPILAYSLTHSGVWTSAVVSLQALPYLVLGLVAGTVADFASRQIVMIVSDLLAAVALLTVPIALLVGGNISIGHVLAAAAVVQSCFVFFDAANFGAVPALVGRDNVVRANSAVFGTSSVLECLLPAAAGALIVVWSPASLLAIDGLSFVISAILVGRIAAPMSEARTGSRGASGVTWSQVAEGIRFIREHPIIRDTTVANLLVCVGSGAFSGLLVVWADVNLDVTEDDILLGVIFSVMAIGGALGSFTSPQIYAVGSPRLVVGSICLLTAGCGLAAVWSTTSYWALPFLCAWEAGVLAAMLIGVSIRQESTPDSLLGRVNTTGRMIALGIGYPVGALVAGWIATASASPSLGISVGIMALPMATAVLAVGGRTHDAGVSP
jgi:hypothetical protein